MTATHFGRACSKAGTQHCYGVWAACDSHAENMGTVFLSAINRTWEGQPRAQKVGEWRTFRKGSKQTYKFFRGWGAVFVFWSPRELHTRQAPSKAVWPCQQANRRQRRLAHYPQGLRGTHAETNAVQLEIESLRAAGEVWAMSWQLFPSSPAELPFGETVHSLLTNPSSSSLLPRGWRGSGRSL